MGNLTVRGIEVKCNLGADFTAAKIIVKESNPHLNDYFVFNDIHSLVLKFDVHLFQSQNV